MRLGCAAPVHADSARSPELCSFAMLSSVCGRAIAHFKSHDRKPAAPIAVNLSGASLQSALP
jgi:hypothetical protein